MKSYKNIVYDLNMDDKILVQEMNDIIINSFVIVKMKDLYKFL